ncbi:MAG: glucose-1-phosphate thymidylyltransferase RfbA [Pelistega sp.]|nr:glucose-1-phosphate thymidylyltransferase RfbA [Pelistega sp.]
MCDKKLVPSSTKATRKGIILAGGLGSRLYPMTAVISKQLLPVFDKPMIYYPLCTLMQAGIQEILIITTPHDMPLFQRLLGDGSAWGLRIEYAQQARPEGIAQALIIAQEFMAGKPVALILGDNIFFGAGFSQQLQQASAEEEAVIFAIPVQDAQRYGVVEFNAENKPERIIEKPVETRSNMAVTGLYFYPPMVCDLAQGLQPSARGELEITDINQMYLERQQLQVQRLASEFLWLDMGTPNSLSEASHIVQAIEQRQGIKIASPEQLAHQQGLISTQALEKLLDTMPKSEYQAYLQRYLAMSDVQS